MGKSGHLIEALVNCCFVCCPFLSSSHVEKNDIRLCLGNVFSIYVQLFMCCRVERFIYLWEYNLTCYLYFVVV